MAMTDTDPIPDPIRPMVELGLTRRQAEVFLFIFDYTLDRGFQPTVRDMMAYFDTKNTNGIYCHFRPLARKGWIAPIRGTNYRAIRFLRNPDGTPFRGFQVRAGD